MEQARSVFNGISYLLLNYHLLLFTAFVDFHTYPLVATSVIYLIWANIGINLTMTVPMMCYSIDDWLKLHYKRYKYRESKAAARKERELEEYINESAKPNL